MLLPSILSAVLALTATLDLPPSCDRPIYCDSKVLHHVQLARLYNDSKTFVDLELLKDEKDIIEEFDVLLKQTNDSPTKAQIETFVNEHFSNVPVLEDWKPTDYSENPLFVNEIKDEKLRKYAKDINDIWPTLGRVVKDDVKKNPDRFSIIPVTHGFIIPGGRFTELYYWDTYWIIEGLLISGMKDTARGMIENLIELLRKYGHIPNGSRCYYKERSQPPLLTAMVSLYVRETKDIEFVRTYIKDLETEMMYWLNSQVVKVEKRGKSYPLLRYYAPSSGPRPESYVEDYENSKFFDTEERRTEFYIDIKSVAESGWDFSSRWFVDSNNGNTGNLTNARPRDLIPVDLNAIFANALQNVAFFHALLGNPKRGAQYEHVAKQWRESIEKVLWDEDSGIWFDYNIQSKKFRKYFYPSNFAPLWMGVVDKRFIRRRAARVLDYLEESDAMSYPGGIPSTLAKTGEQWDFPNAWPPLVSIMVNALEALGTEDGKRAAFQVAQTWVRACYIGFKNSNQMFEKYDAEVPGRVGGGGEYTVQNGFGWSNGVVLEFLAKYGDSLSAEESNDSSDSSLDDSPESGSTETKKVPSK